MRTISHRNIILVSLISLVSLVLLLFYTPSASAQLASKRLSRKTLPSFALRVSRSAEKAKVFLASKIGSDGKCAGEYDEDNPRFGGKTALCAYALLSIDPHQKTLALPRAIKWLTGAKLRGTYPIALRACVLAGLKDPKARKILARDVKLLVEAAGKKGRYSYLAIAGDSDEVYDNSNSCFGVLGVWAGFKAGIDVPQEYWKQVRDHWINQQQYDGGWGYRIPPGAVRTRSYGSMTASAMASLQICQRALRAKDKFSPINSGESAEILAGLKWLGDNFSAKQNPKKGVEWFYYWLFNAQRASGDSGRKRFGKADWFASGARELLDLQRDNGSFGYDDGVANTAFSLLFLARGYRPIAINKLRYPGKWNTRNGDASMVARWLSGRFEQPVSWQIVSLESTDEDMRESPILYLSGAGPVQLQTKQLKKLRDYALSGGLILSESAGNNGDFTLDIANAWKKAFPEFEYQRIDEDDAIFIFGDASAKYRKGLWGVHNGVRFLAIHSSGDISRSLQKGSGDKPDSAHELLASIYLYATGQHKLPIRGETSKPAAPWSKKNPPVATIKLARVKYDGNYNPEPHALPALADQLARNNRIKLELSNPIEITDLDAKSWPIASMTSSDAFELTDKQFIALRKYLNSGGTLIVDSAGGNKPAARAIEKYVLKGTLHYPAAQNHKIYTAENNPIKKILYRSSISASVGRVRIAKNNAGRIEIYFSRDDLTAGLLGVKTRGIAGYSPAIARAIYTNILCGITRIKNNDE